MILKAPRFVVQSKPIAVDGILFACLAYPITTTHTCMTHDNNAHARGDTSEERTRTSENNAVKIENCKHLMPTCCLRKITVALVSQRETLEPIGIPDVARSNLAATAERMASRGLWLAATSAYVSVATEIMRSKNCEDMPAHNHVDQRERHVSKSVKTRSILRHATMPMSNCAIRTSARLGHCIPSPAASVD